MIWQPYHHIDQMKNLCPSVFRPLDCTEWVNEYFENQIILDKFAENGDDPYFGVISHALKKKTTIGEADVERYLAKKYDAWIFSRQNRNQYGQFFLTTTKRHPHFAPLFDWLLESIGKGYDWRNTTKYPFEVHFNFIIARSEMFADYIENYLGPAMLAMKNADGEIREMLWTDANYNSTNISEYRRREKFTRLMGIPHFPHHPFLLERLWMVYFSKLPTIERLRLNIWTR